MYVWATWMAAAFRAAGLDVVEVDGWRTRGRPASSGSFNPYGLNVHHTGGTSSALSPTPALSLLVGGRSDLPGPIAHFATDWHGRIWVIAAGRANVNGANRGVPNIPAGDGNRDLMGNEVFTNGTQTMPQAQLDAIALSSAVVLEHFGKPVDGYLYRHADTSKTGKWDIGQLTTAALRAITKAAPGSKSPTSAWQDRVNAVPGTRTVALWSVGTDVTRLQQLLHIGADGYFGAGTEAAVRTWQRSKGLGPDGVVGPATWKALLATPTVPVPAPPTSEEDDMPTADEVADAVVKRLTGPLAAEVAKVPWATLNASINKQGTGKGTTTSVRQQMAWQEHHLGRIIAAQARLEAVVAALGQRSGLAPEEITAIADAVEAKVNADLAADIAAELDVTIAPKGA